MNGILILRASFGAHYNTVECDNQFPALVHFFSMSSPARDCLGFEFIMLCMRRRSAVSRQACHVISVMAQSLGTRFEGLAMAFLPVLFKVLVITVQVQPPLAPYLVPGPS